MSKDEFKRIFRELCETEEITFRVESSNDGYKYLRIYVDGQFITENIIYK